MLSSKPLFLLQMFQTILRLLNIVIVFVSCMVCLLSFSQHLERSKNLTVLIMIKIITVIFIIIIVCNLHCSSLPSSVIRPWKSDEITVVKS